MRFLLTMSVALFPFSAAAQVSEADQAQIINEAQEFGAAIRDGVAIEHSIAQTFEPYALTATRYFDLSSTDELFDLMRQGYKQSQAILEINDFNVDPDGAVFGQADAWNWGVVPYTSQSRMIETGEINPRECGAFFVFGQSGVWYSQARDELSDLILHATMPEFTVLEDPRPACAEPSS